MFGRSKLENQQRQELQTLVNEHLRLYEVTLDRKGETLGFNIAHRGDEPVMRITAINEGVALSWNKQPVRTRFDIIEIGDEIVAVNGTGEAASKMLDVLKANDVLTLRIRRKPLALRLEDFVKTECMDVTQHSKRPSLVRALECVNHYQQKRKHGFTGRKNGSDPRSRMVELLKQWLRRIAYDLSPPLDVVVRYLPKQINGAVFLTPCDAKGEFRVDGSGPGTEGPGLCFRRSMDVADRDERQRFVAWGSIVRGEDKGEWVMVKVREEVEIQQMALLCTGILRFPDLFPQHNVPSFMKTIEEVRRHLQHHLTSSAGGVAGKIEGTRSSASTTASDGESASDEDLSFRATGKSRLMQVEIELNGQILGIDINYHDNITLLVTRVRKGPVVAHNLANPDSAVLVGDRFQTINGSQGDAKQLLEAVKRDAAMKATLRRGDERLLRLGGSDNAHLSPNSESVSTHGISTIPHDSMCLVINEDPSVGSLLAVHNSMQQKLSVGKGDYIVGVNGIKGSAEQLQAALDEGDAWEISWRPSIYRGNKAAIERFLAHVSKDLPKRESGNDNIPSAETTEVSPDEPTTTNALEDEIAEPDFDETSSCASLTEDIEVGLFTVMGTE